MVKLLSGVSSTSTNNTSHTKQLDGSRIVGSTKSPVWVDFELFPGGSLIVYPGAIHAIDSEYNDGTFSKTRVRRSIVGAVTFIELTGCVFKLGGFAPNTAFATLPEGYRPPQELTFEVKQQESAYSRSYVSNGITYYERTTIIFKTNGQIMNTRGGSFNHLVDTNGNNICFAFATF